MGYILLFLFEKLKAEAVSHSQETVEMSLSPEALTPELDLYYLKCRFFHYYETNGSGDTCHWKDAQLITHSSKEERAHRFM